MSARKSEGLRVRMWDGGPIGREEKPPERSIRELIDEKTSGWKELGIGDRGTDISRVRFAGLGRRDLVAEVDPLGGYLKDSKLPTTYIEAVGSRMVLADAGSSIISVNSMDPYPKVTSDGDVYHPVEGNPITAANIEFGMVQPTAHCVGVSCNFSRMFPAVVGEFSERVILETITRRGARAIDNDAIVGSGTEGEPLGVVNDPNIGSTSGATYSATTLAEQRRIIEAAHFVPTAALGNAATAKILRTREKATGTGIFILGDDNRLGGVPFLVTEAMPGGTLLMGDFGELVVLLQSVQLNRNPYSRAKEGFIEYDLFHFFDVIVRHAGAFCKAVNLS